MTYGHTHQYGEPTTSRLVPEGGGSTTSAYPTQGMSMAEQQPFFTQSASQEFVTKDSTSELPTETDTTGGKKDFPSLIRRISKHNSKTKTHMNHMLGLIELSYKEETGRKIALKSLISNLPEKADTWDNIKKYSTVFKTLVKEKLVDAPKTKEAVAKGSAKRFWEESEKPNQPKSVKKSGSKSSSSNPYFQPASMWQLKPFFRKNNIWMYGAAALLLGGGYWWLSKD